MVPESILRARAQELAAATPAASAPAADPQTESQRMRSYWSNESEAFSRVMSAMENGTAQLKQVQTGYMDETGNPETELRMVAPDGPLGYNSLTLRATPREGVYQFSTPNQVAGGMIHGVIQADPKTGQYAPVQDYTKQIQYTPGQSGSFFGNLIGDLGDMYKSLGPIAPLIGNAIAPGLGSALSAVAALDEGNTTGAILSGLSAAGSYGNAALQAGDTTGLGGTLAENLPEIKTATSAVQLANAVQSGNVGSALNAAANLTGVSANEDISTVLKAAGLVQALDSGNIGQTLVLAGQLTDSPDVKVAGDAVKLINGINSGNFGAVQNAATSLAKAAGASDFEGDVNAVLDSAASKTTSDAGGILNSDEVVAGTQQLIDAITNPSSTASYSGTQLADAGRAGDPGSGVYWDSSIGAWRVADQATDEDLEQLGVGLATDTGTGTGTKTDTQTADQTDAQTATGTTLTGTDGSTLTINNDGTVTSTAATETGTGTDTITGGQDSQDGGQDSQDGGQDSQDGGQDSQDGGQDSQDGGQDTTCAAGFHWDEDRQMCMPDDDTTDGEDTQDGGQDSQDGGQDTTCAAGFHWDDSLQMCVPDDDTTDDPTNCPDGYVYNFETRTCEPVTGTDTSTECAAGFHWDEDRQMCMPDDDVNTECADGFHWDENLQICVADDDETETSTDCPDGYVYNVVTKTCEPITTDTGTGTGTGTGTKTGTGTSGTKSTTNTQTQQTQQQSPGFDLNALLGLLGAADQQKPPSVPLVDIGEQLDLEAPLQTNPFAKKQTQSKMAEGGSIDDLLALLQQRG